MTPTPKENTRDGKDIVETVARAIDKASDYRPAYSDEWPTMAQAAIRATLEYVRDNVSVGMLASAIPLADGDPPHFAKRLAASAVLHLSGGRKIPNEGDVVPHAAQIIVDFRAMLSTALYEIEGA